MGGVVSAGKDNGELIDNLIAENFIGNERVELVFRCVDRGFYFIPNEEAEAYRDSAWRSGNLHISAPCIYAKALEALELSNGCSFLNIGSGTGYLSTLAAFLLGPRGVNHGIELKQSVMKYANNKFAEFFRRSDAVHEFEISAPQFVVGNALLIEPSRKYNRIYCGAAIHLEDKQFFLNMLTIGGILVAPVDDELVKVTRLGEREWLQRVLLVVSFTDLSRPRIQSDSATKVKLPAVEVPSLCHLCRLNIRSRVREHVRDDVPKRESRISIILQRKKTRSKSKVASGDLANVASDSGFNSNSNLRSNANAATQQEHSAQPMRGDNSEDSLSSSCFTRRSGNALKSARLHRDSSSSSLSSAENCSLRKLIRLDPQTIVHALCQPSLMLSGDSEAAGSANMASHESDSDSDSSEADVDSVPQAVALDSDLDVLSFDHDHASVSSSSTSESRELEFEQEVEDDDDNEVEVTDDDEDSVDQVTDEDEDDEIGEVDENGGSSGIVLLQDYFGEQSERPKFRTLMRNAIDSLNFPTSLKNYLMFESSARCNPERPAVHDSNSA